MYVCRTFLDVFLLKNYVFSRVCFIFACVLLYARLFMMQRKFQILALIVGIWFTMQPYAGLAASFASSVESPTTPDTTLANRYPYLHFVEKGYDVNRDGIDLTEDEFYNRAARLVFPVNKFNLSVDDPLLKELANDVIPELNKDSLRLQGVMLRGASSPEGPFLYNARLSRLRANSLMDFLREKLTFRIDNKVFEHQTDPVDYRTLLYMMRRANDPDCQKVESLVNRHLPRREYTLLKNKLRIIQGGKLWNRLNRDYFPQLRTARFMLLIEKQQAEQKPAPVAVPVPQPAMPTEKVELVVDSMPAQLVSDCTPRREFLSIKTNLLFYGVWMPNYNRWCPIPNVGIEYYPKRGHFTFGASLDFPWWRHKSVHKYFQIRNYQLETRYYLKDGANGTHEPNETNRPYGANRGGAFRGFYLLGYVHAGLFEIGFDKDTGWKGEGFGAGIGVGYMMPISKNGHWRLDFGLQVGWLTCRYDPYQYENLVNLDYHDDLYYYRWTGKASDFKERQYRFNWLGPTRVGITLTYDLLYRRQSKKGVSFKAYEPHEANKANGTYGANKANKPERRTAR